MGEIKRITCAQAIAFLCDRKRYKMKIGRQERFAPGPFGHSGDPRHRPDHPVADLFVKNGERVEVVLGLNRVAQRRAFHGNAMDSPTRVTRQQQVKIVCLMSAMECARTDMEHARPNRRTVISRHANAAQVGTGERCVRQSRG